MVIDPIDGTLAFLDHVRSSGCMHNTFLPETCDYALLGGIVEKGKPRFGFSYNYITGDKIFLDSRGDVTRKGFRRKSFSTLSARYADIRANDSINQTLSNDASVSTYHFRSLGLASLYAQLNNHDSFVLAHFPQANGLWDILPAAVAAKFSGANLLDGNGNKVSFTEYVMIPKGVVMYRGEKFSFLEKALRKSQQSI
jgi:fructose-1,6-bisphosphatase/inositol monophosphatase family enzyme